MKTHQNLLRKCLPFLLLAIVIFTGCKKKEDAPSSGETSATAEIAVTRVTTPGGRVYYMGAYSSLPSVLDYADMVELGANVTVYSYGEHPYAWNGNSSTLTKYNVSNTLEISVNDVVSFASTGLSGFFGPPAFISETQAFFFALGEGKVIEFNPSTMEITEIISVSALPNSADTDIKTRTYYSYVTSGNKIILPVEAEMPATGDVTQFPQYAQMAIFDPVAKTITYSDDDRMSMGYYACTKDVSNGDLYYRPSSNIARAETYANLATPYPTSGGFLKASADGNFDEDFFLDLKDSLDAHSILSVIYVYGTKAVVQYLPSTFNAPSDQGQWAASLAGQSVMVLYDLSTGSYESFTALSTYGTVYSIGNVNGQEYYGTFGGSGSAAGKYYFLRQTGASTFEVAAEAKGGSGIYYAKLR
ncbi:MAG: putative lipoprotein [Cytophagaceae bacterium]|jgi:hypothetical protein|nr:putative lipoprotein [Cytophagaceae bacterium]